MTQNRILLVEDDPVQRFTLAMDLREAGFSVREAANASEAQTVLAGDAEIDLLITDVDMPGAENGVALARKVRERLPKIEIIVVSASPPDKGLVGVADAFFGKPYDARRLVGSARALIGSRKRG